MPSKYYWKILIVVLCILLIIAASTQIHTYNVGEIVRKDHPSPRVWQGFNIFFIILGIGIIGGVAALVFWPSKVKQMVDSADAAIDSARASASTAMTNLGESLAPRPVDIAVPEIPSFEPIES